MKKYLNRPVFLIYNSNKIMKTNKTINLSFISMVILIIILEGVIPNIFTIWNLIPILIYYFLFKNWIKYRNKTLVKFSLILNGIFLIIFPLVVNVMRAFDIQWFKTWSSTSAIIFIFIPLYAILFSIIPAITQVVFISKLKHKNKTGL